MAEKGAKYHINLQLTYNMVHQSHPTISEAFHSSPFLELPLLFLQYISAHSIASWHHAISSLPTS
jgi:hypothetical protein